MATSQVNELLGYPPDARLLIVNADDFGMYPAINQAVLRSFREGIVRSTTLMTPCQGAPEAMRILKENSDIPFGVHLTVISDIDDHPIMPVSPKDAVPSLLDENGNFFHHVRISEFLQRAKLDELEIEFRAQIGTVLDAGLTPTHLDWHCLHAGGSEAIFDLTFGLSREFGLAIRVADSPLSRKLLRHGLPSAEHNLLDSFSLETEGKTARYLQLLRDLPAGLSEWAVHPGLDTAEAQAFDPGGWPVRQADFDFLTSLEAKDTIEAEGITLLGFGALKEAWHRV